MKERTVREKERERGARSLVYREMKETSEKKRAKEKKKREERKE